MKRRTPVAVALLLVMLSACSIFGVHYKIHNPRIAGKYPKRTEALRLLGDQESKYRTCYDVKYYGLHIVFGNDLSKDKGISGSVVMTAVAVHDFDTLQIDLRENLELETLYAEDTNRVPLKFTRRHRAVLVAFPKQVPVGETFTLVMNYSGTPMEAKKAPWAGGFVRKTDDLKNPWWGVACESDGASVWWPCKDVINDEPDSANIVLDVPKGFIGVSNGTLTARAPVSETQESFAWHVSYPINPYNITFYIGKYKLLHDEYVSPVTHDTLPLNHYVLEQHYEQAKTQFRQAKDHLRFYEETFGPYAFYRDGYKLVESPYEGMEHQSAIAYGHGFVTDAYGFDYIILHETAHEWWGNAVTACDLADGWIHEGFASYCEALYVEKKYGRKMYEQYLLRDRILIINRRPVVAPYGIRYFDYRDGDIYMKGAWVLHSLRYAVNNDSLFFDILRSFYMQSRYRNVTTQDLLRLVNEKTGEDYGWFFDQYLHSRFVPELEYCVHDHKLYYRWNPSCSDSSFHHLPVRYRLGESGWSHTPDIVPSVKISEMQVPGLEEKFTFKNELFLFKPVENKKLARLYRKGE